jgi:serine/threonine protein phosphatase PrpC
MATDQPIPPNNKSSTTDTASFPPQTALHLAELQIEFAARSHIGLVRRNNEDQYLVLRLRKALDVLATSLAVEERAELRECGGYFLLVADGMGGPAAGEHASAVVANAALKHIAETAKWFFRLDDPDEEVRLRLLHEGLERVDRELIAEARRDPSLAGMGTTLTAISLLGDEGFIVHVGDSRAYLWREERLEQLTRDHTFAQKLVDLGLLEPAEARVHRRRHVLTNAIGGLPGVEAEIVKVHLRDGDRLLLCTDGLNEAITDDQIAAILAKSRPSEEMCDALIAAALSCGGPDNITVVVANCAIQHHRP